jgi:hypothetical protein
VQLIVVTCVVRIVVAQLVLAFFVVKLTLVLIFWVLVALLKGVITLWSLRGAGLECLVTAIRRNLVLLFLLAFVVVGAMATMAVVATLPLVILMIISLVASVTMAIACATLFCDIM